ncbi:hypothetical protein NC652_022792 [Populus alba x Populus x berolinensis]|nr:hypothetical protein NC652_022792 [Populus alba x Populus x berolinensis]
MQNCSFQIAIQEVLDLPSRAQDDMRKHNDSQGLTSCIPTQKQALRRMQKAVQSSHSSSVV